MQNLTSASNKINKHKQENDMSCKPGHKLYHSYVCTLKLAKCFQNFFAIHTTSRTEKLNLKTGERIDCCNKK